MDSITAGAFALTITAASLYALYWIVRKAVAAGIRDAGDPAKPSREPAKSD